VSSHLETNKAIVRRLYERLMANGDVAAAEEILDDSYVDHSLPGNAEGGRAELIGVVQAVRAAMPDIAPVVDQAVAEGDLVAVRITARGRHTGAPFPPGIPASGRAIEWREQHIFRVADGRIAEHWGVFDKSVDPPAAGRRANSRMIVDLDPLYPATIRPRERQAEPAAASARPISWLALLLKQATLDRARIADPLRTWVGPSEDLEALEPNLTPEALGTV
jgi:predicted SnoaL-like aldol condensation-catalyzing enzyme